MGTFNTRDVGHRVKSQPNSKLESWIKFSTWILRLISTIYDAMFSKGISHDEKSSIDKKPEAPFSGTIKGQNRSSLITKKAEFGSKNT